MSAGSDRTPGIAASSVAARTTDCGAQAAAPVITIDGPTASGKGTVAQRVATALGFGVLDSGALYRLTALAVLQRDVDPADAADPHAPDNRRVVVTWRLL